MQSRYLSRRPLLAGLLGMVYPGLGHVYLRAWLRAIAWFGLALVTAALVVPHSAVVAFQQQGIDGLMAASRTFSLEVTASLLAVRLLNVVDAYLTGIRQDQTAERAATETATDVCPNCGGELDPELDFCPWCTTRLADDEADDAEPTVR